MATTKAARKRAAKKAAPKKEVHRSLHLVSPLMSGEDIRQLKRSIKGGFKHREIDWLPLKVDAKANPQTFHAAKFYAWALGLGKGHLDPIRKGTIPEATQKLLRSPETRSRMDRLREKRRKKRLATIRKKQTEGPAAAIAYARSFVGTTENPTGSNTGPLLHNDKGQPGGVSFWQEHWGLNGSFWCLSFASYCAAVIGGAQISGNVSYSVAIEGYARNHENGFIEVAASDAKPGDFSIWKFDGPDAASDHGELIVKTKRGPIEDIGGNTSSEGGSQSNGGGVFVKTIGSAYRPLSELSMVVRPLYS